MRVATVELVGRHEVRGLAATTLSSVEQSLLLLRLIVSASRDTFSLFLLRNSTYAGNSSPKSLGSMRKPENLKNPWRGRCIRVQVVVVEGTVV